MSKANLSTKTSVLSTIALFITALFSPCCFPLFGFIASAFGFGSFELFGGWTMWLFQLMVLVSIAGMIFSYRKHACTYPLLIAVPNGLLIFSAIHLITLENWVNYMYVGMMGLFVATIWDYRRSKLNQNCDTCATYNGKTVELASTITCPNCAHSKDEMMPTDSCSYFYECEKCKTILKPLSGDCCVYCSYGTVKCPPIQADVACC